jgi:hypothetical protein
MTFILREDEALKELFQGIEVSDGKSTHRPVTVRFTLPDIEIGSMQFPLITIDLIDIVQSKERQTSGFMYDTDLGGAVVATDNRTYMYEIPTMWDLYYQITTYARHPLHDRALLNAVLKYKTPGKYGHLPIPNADKSVYEYRHMFVESFVKRDTIDDGRRLYRNTITVRVMSEMTQDAAQNALYNVQSVQVTTNSANVPSDYTPLQFSVYPE